MKNLLKYTFATLMGALLFASCTNEYEYDGVGQAEQNTASGAYFLGSANKSSVELEPGSVEFDITLSRTNTENAQTVNIKVVSDEAGVFEVPSTASFAAGENTATIHITAPNAKEGEEYDLTVGIADEHQSIYSVGMQAFTVHVAIQKWENLGTCYWIDGIISQFYGVNPSFAYAVQVQKLINADGFRLRFVGPYSFAATGRDELGAFIGYPYKAGSGDEQEHLFVIDVTKAGAYLHPVSMGIDWGYGTMSTGSIYGNLSNNAATYPLGTYDEKAGVITFPLNSLYLNDDDGPAVVKKNPTYLYLSAEAYINSLTEE